MKKNYLINTFGLQLKEHKGSSTRLGGGGAMEERNATEAEMVALLYM